MLNTVSTLGDLQPQLKDLPGCDIIHKRSTEIRTHARSTRSSTAASSPRTVQEPQAGNYQLSDGITTAT